LQRLTLGAVLLAATVGSGWAHAVLEASRPEAGASIPAGKIAMQLRYNSRIDRARSKLVLTGPDHTPRTLAIAPDGPPDVINTSTDLAPGAYVVRWQVLAVDGHITRGDVPFTVVGH
jgi:hypothetical protein